MTEPAQVVDQFGQAWSDHDLEGALALCTDDIVFEATGPAPDGDRAEGKMAVSAAWEPIFADSQARFVTEETFVAGDRVVERWRYEWSDGHVRGVDVIQVRDGLVAEKLSYVKG